MEKEEGKSFIDFLSFWGSVNQLLSKFTSHCHHGVTSFPYNKLEYTSTSANLFLRNWLNEMEMCIGESNTNGAVRGSYYTLHNLTNSAKV